jgi:hypothetical protein
VLGVAIVFLQYCGLGGCHSVVTVVETVPQFYAVVFFCAFFWVGIFSFDHAC